MEKQTPLMLWCRSFITQGTLLLKILVDYKTEDRDPNFGVS